MLPSLVTHLESPLSEYRSTEASPRDVVLEGLKRDTPYWPELALGWLEQGVSVDAEIASCLESIGRRGSWPQRLRRRARTILHAWRASMAVSYFQVDELRPGGLIIGRNGYVVIPVGATFTSLRKMKIVQETDGLRSIDLGEIGQVALRLDKVEWFRQFIGAVPRGHSAGLHVSGAGLELIAESLAALVEREYVSLHPPT